MAKFCTNCGKEIDENADVCVHCGTMVKKNNASGVGAVEDLDKKAQNALTFGLIGIVAWLLPIAGYIITILGIVNGAKGLQAPNNSGKAKTGLVLSIIFLIATLANSIAGVMMNL